MLGDDSKCEEYDAGVNSTPVWKLKRVLNKLPVTNNLGNRLAEEPPPLGFKWGKTL